MSKVTAKVTTAETATILAHDIANIWIEPSKIPPRQWIYGKHYIRQFISSTVAPGGGGKSTLVLAEAISIAIGRNLIGSQVRSKHKVWYWNGEDPVTEILRRVAATCIHHSVTLDELRGQLFISSGREDGSKIQIAYADEKGGFKLDAPNVGKLENFVRQNSIDVIIIDPFVRTVRRQRL